MKLYTFAGAPNPRRVHIYLAEKGIDVPFEQVDIMKRENRTPEFMSRVNAMGGLPVLELDDGSHIAESIAICRYFEAEHPDPPLFGATAREQGIVEMWIRRIELNFMMPVGMVWVHGSPLTKGVVKRQIPEMAEQSRKLVRSYFDFLDRHLEDHEFLAGDVFSVADIIALCTADFASKLNDLPHSTEQTHLSRWYHAVAERPSASA
ncbi:MAG: glutathione S-transferase family protein [Myxococcota bacterium]|nr:glutathione S-transferase family protein [Myxococcota bacterium]